MSKAAPTADVKAAPTAEIRIAGQSTRHVSPEIIAESATGDLSSYNTWSQCPAESFSLRVGPKYSSQKKKEPSPPALMNLVAVE